MCRRAGRHIETAKILNIFFDGKAADLIRKNYIFAKTFGRPGLFVI